MDDDKLLRELGALAKQQQDDDVMAEVRPIDAAAQERMTNALAAKLQRSSRSRWPSRVGLVTSALALAAGLTVFVRSSSTGVLPSYTLDSSGVATQRAPSAASGPCKLNANSTGSFELVARPDEAVEGTVRALAFAARGPNVEPWEGSLEVSPKGTVRIVGDNRTLTTASELRIVIRRTDTLSPTEALAMARAPEKQTRETRVLTCAVEAR